jgi:flagellar biosynthetic protein FliO
VGLAPTPPPLEEMKGYSAASDPGMGDFIWSFVRSMLMLGVVLALVYLVLHKGLGKLVQKTQSGRRMKVVDRLGLDQRRALYLVEVDGEQMLLAATDGGVSRVDREPPPAPAPEPKRFTTDGLAPERPPLTGVLAHEPPASAEGNKNGAPEVEPC